MALIYRKPLPLPNGTMLGRNLLQLFDDNDRYFRSYLGRMQTIPRVTERGFGALDTSTTKTVWTGWHWLSRQATTLSYWFKTTCDANCTCDLYYNNVRIYQGDAPGVVDQVHSGTVDLLAYPGLTVTGGNLYKVEFKLSRSGALESGTAVCMPPWTTYNSPDVTSNPGLSYHNATTTPQWPNGVAAKPGDFTKIIQNDLYFRDQISPQAAGFAADGGFWSGNSTKYATIWTGAVVYSSLCKRIWYKIKASSSSGDAWVQIRFNSTAAGIGTGEEVWESDNLTATEAEFEGYADIAGTYTEGSVYMVRVQLYRSDDENEGAANIEYLFYGAAYVPDMNDPYDRTVGSTVLGQAEGAAKRWTGHLSYLATNDATINTYLTRRDFAVSAIDVERPENNENEWMYLFVRLGDFLYYRGLGGKLLYCYDQKSVSLKNSEDADYLILDLNQVPGLHYGMIYAVQGVAMEFAMEVQAGEYGSGLISGSIGPY